MAEHEGIVEVREVADTDRFAQALKLATEARDDAARHLAHARKGRDELEAEIRQLVIDHKRYSSAVQAMTRTPRTRTKREG